LLTTPELSSMQSVLIGRDRYWTNCTPVAGSPTVSSWSFPTTVRSSQLFTASAPTDNVGLVKFVVGAKPSCGSY